MEAGMELSRMNSRLRVTFYEAEYANEGDLSTELERVSITGFREALVSAREWLTQDEPRRITMSHNEAKDFLAGSVPDLIVRAHNSQGVEELVAVVEVDYADATE